MYAKSSALTHDVSGTDVCFLHVAVDSRLECAELSVLDWNVRDFGLRFNGDILLKAPMLTDGQSIAGHLLSPVSTSFPNSQFGKDK